MRKVVSLVAVMVTFSMDSAQDPIQQQPSSASLAPIQTGSSAFGASHVEKRKPLSSPHRAPMERLKTDLVMLSPDTASLTPFDDEENSTSPKSEVETKRGRERELKCASEERTKKDARDAQLLWMSYDTLLTVGSSEYFGDISCDQFKASIEENSNILRAKRLSVFGKKTHMVTPVEAVIEAWGEQHSIKIRPKLEELVLSMLKFDGGHEYMINTLRYLIRLNRVGAYTCMEEALLHKPDLSHSPELIVELVDWCVEPLVSQKPVIKQGEPKPVVKQDQIELVPKKQKKTLKEKIFGGHIYTSVPSIVEGTPSLTEDILSLSEMLASPRIIRFQERNKSTQTQLLRIARLLVNQGASLSGLCNDFPPVDHAGKCVSCFYLRNCMLDKRAGLLVGGI